MSPRPRNLNATARLLPSSSTRSGHASRRLGSVDGGFGAVLSAPPIERSRSSGRSGRRPSGRYRRIAARACAAADRRDHREIFLARGRRQRHLRPRAEQRFYLRHRRAGRAGHGAQGVAQRARGRRWRSTAPPTGSKSSFAATRDRLKEHKVDDSAEAYVENAGYTIFSPPEASETRQADIPAIVAETRVDIPDASVSDAVMLMDLRNTNALLFKNSGTGEFNMIYRREDGNIGWVEPHTA